MMKKLFAVAAMALAASAAFAGPFGLSMGMSVEQVTQACGGNAPEKIENDDRYFILPEKSHPVFKFYIAWISEDSGLYAVRGISDEVFTNKYGEEIKSRFYSMLERVEKIYGKGKLFDGMADKFSLYDDDNYWLYALRQGARRLCASWGTEKGKAASEKNGVQSIELWAASDDTDTAVLIIDYTFQNQAEVRDKQDETL